MKVFFDSEFTGLHKNTTLISIGLVNEFGGEFYAEFTDYDEFQVDRWIADNVISNLTIHEEPGFSKYHSEGKKMWKGRAKGDTAFVEKHLVRWLNVFESPIEMWSDCLAYDWVLFNDIFGHAFNIPECVCYIPFDICTLFQIMGIDPDISREEFAGSECEEKHNALHDAKIIRKCYEKLMKKLDELRADNREMFQLGNVL